MGSILLQSEIIKQSTYFSPVNSFVKNFHDAHFEFQLNDEKANAQHLFRLSGTGQMSVHKCRNTIWCALSGQGGKGGGVACGLLGSKNPAARRRQQSALLWHMTHKFWRCAHYKHDKDIGIMLF